MVAVWWLKDYRASAAVLVVEGPAHLTIEMTQFHDVESSDDTV